MLWMFGSQLAHQAGSRNYVGISDPVVDALIEKIVEAPDRVARVAASRALDRVLLWQHYTIPHYYPPYIPIVYWDRFGRPEKDATWFNLIWHMSNWWVDPAKDAALNTGEVAE